MIYANDNEKGRRFIIARGEERPLWSPVKMPDRLIVKTYDRLTGHWVDEASEDEVQA